MAPGRANELYVVVVGEGVCRPFLRLLCLLARASQRHLHVRSLLESIAPLRYRLPVPVPVPAPGTRACSAVLGSAPSAALTPTESTPEPATSLACGSVSRSLAPVRASCTSTRARTGVTGPEAPSALSVAARLCARGFAGPVALSTLGASARARTGVAGPTASSFPRSRRPALE